MFEHIRQMIDIGIDQSGEYLVSKIDILVGNQIVGLRKVDISLPLMEVGKALGASSRELLGDVG